MGCADFISTLCILTDLYPQCQETCTKRSKNAHFNFTGSIIKIPQGDKLRDLHQGKTLKHKSGDKTALFKKKKRTRFSPIIDLTVTGLNGVHVPVKRTGKHFNIIIKRKRALQLHNNISVCIIRSSLYLSNINTIKFFSSYIPARQEARVRAQFLNIQYAIQFLTI